MPYPGAPHTPGRPLVRAVFSLLTTTSTTTTVVLETTDSPWTALPTDLASRLRCVCCVELPPGKGKWSPGGEMPQSTCPHPPTRPSVLRNSSSHARHTALVPLCSYHIPYTYLPRPKPASDSSLTILPIPSCRPLSSIDGSSDDRKPTCSMPFISVIVRLPCLGGSKDWQSHLIYD